MRGRPGEELAELLWDDGPALRTTTTPRFPPPAPFQPFSCSAAGSSSISMAHELSKRHGAGAVDDDGVPVLHNGNDDDADAVPWLHCPVIDDTAPLPPTEYCAGMLSGGYPGLNAVPAAAPGIERPSSNGAVVVPPEAAAAQLEPNAAGEGVMNFPFFSGPLQRPQASTPSNPVESTAAQTAASRLRSTPLFSEHRMAWLQPPKDPRATAMAPKGAPSAPDHVVEAAATVTRHRLQQPDADATAAVTASSVSSGNGGRSRAKTSSQQPAAEWSFSQDEDMEDEPGGATRRPAARGTKRTRTAEVHNLSERRRRDRINEKMRALQELIPSCNKVDKASMLEEAIEYLKTLQLQVQMMMSMGATGLCAPPMLMQVPPMAHFAHLGVGLGFGLGAAAAFDALPRLAGAQFPCTVMPPMAVPPAPMFGVPGPSPALFPHMAGEHLEAAAATPVRCGAGAAGDNPPVAVAPQVDEKLQHPKQT